MTTVSSPRTQWTMVTTSTFYDCTVVTDGGRHHCPLRARRRPPSDGLLAAEIGRGRPNPRPFSDRQSDDLPVAGLDIHQPAPQAPEATGSPTPSPTCHILLVDGRLRKSARTDPKYRSPTAV